MLLPPPGLWGAVVQHNAHRSVLLWLCQSYSSGILKHLLPRSSSQMISHALELGLKPDSWSFYAICASLVYTILCKNKLRCVYFFYQSVIVEARAVRTVNLVQDPWTLMEPVPYAAKSNSSVEQSLPQTEPCRTQHSPLVLMPCIRGAVFLWTAPTDNTMDRFCQTMFQTRPPSTHHSNIMWFLFAMSWKTTQCWNSWFCDRTLCKLIKF